LTQLWLLLDYFYYLTRTMLTSWIGPHKMFYIWPWR